MLLRLLTTGLCGAGVVLLATFQPVRLEVVAPDRPPDPRPAPALSIVDVAAQVAPDEIVELVRLSPGEHLLAINDRPLSDDLAAAPLITLLAPRPGEYLDMTIASATSERRVLVLLH